MGRISERIAAIAESATLAVDAKAKALQQAGEDVIGFGAGEPDFPTPKHIVDAAREACANPRFHKYTPTPGLPELRAAIAHRASASTGQEISAAHVLVTNGAKQAVAQTFATLLDPGDEVLVPSPFWVTYTEAIALTGATSVEVWAGPERGFLVGVDELEAARTARTKAVLLNSPCNPTGAVLPPEELERIGRWALEHSIFVVTDEIYSYLVYDGATSPSIRALVPELGELCVIVDGVSKTYAMTGWRVGWMIGPPDVIGAATNFQSHFTSNVDNVAQVAALAALEGDFGAADEMRDAFDRRRRTAVKMLGEIPGVECVEPSGAFYVFPSVEGLYGRRIGDRTPQSALEVAEALLESVRVAVVPGEAFGAPGFVRLSYALSDDALEEGLRRIASAAG